MCNNKEMAFSFEKDPRKILITKLKDHAWERNKLFYAKTKVSAFAKKKKKKKKMLEKSAVYCKSLEQCTLRALLCIKTLVDHVMCLKRPITAPFERYEPFHLLRLMGVSVPSLHIESTDSMIYI